MSSQLRKHQEPMFELHAVLWKVLESGNITSNVQYKDQDVCTHALDKGVKTAWVWKVQRSWQTGA